MKIRTRTVIILLALASACFGQEKKPPIAIDCTFNNLDPVKLGPHLGGFSNTKVAPEKIVFWRYSRPEFNPKIQYDRDYVVLGNGFGHITKQTDWRDFGAKLRKIASDHRANVIGYEISGTELRVLFLRIPDEKLNAALRQKDAKLQNVMKPSR
jgi:hypothetical protein